MCSAAQNSQSIREVSTTVGGVLTAVSDFNIFTPSKHVSTQTFPCFPEIQQLH